MHELTPEEANKFESAEEQEQQLDVKITLQLLQAVQMACTGRSYRGGGHQEHKLDRFFDDKFDFTRNYGETIGVFTSICYYQVRVTSSVSRNCGRNSALELRSEQCTGIVYQKVFAR